MKKTLCLLLTMLLAVSLFAACGKEENGDNKDQNTSATVNTPAAETNNATATPVAEPETTPEPAEEDTACLATPFSGTMEEFINAIYEKHNEIELALGSMPVSVTDENDLVYNAGITDGSLVSEVCRSEAWMGQAYSLVCARVNDASDAPKVAQMMFDNIDTRKWICVEADTKIAAYCGDIVMFFMVNSEFEDTVSTESIQKAFLQVCPDGTIIE